MCRLVIFIFLSIQYCIQGQSIVGFHTSYFDSFRAWNVDYVENDTLELTDENIRTATIELAWNSMNNWEEWDHEIGGERNRFLLRGNTHTPYFQYEIENVAITSRPQWPNDLSEWTLTFRDISYKLQSKIALDVFEWEILVNRTKVADIYPINQGDLTVWEYYYFNEITLPLEVQMMFTNMIIYFSTPKI